MNALFVRRSEIALAIALFTALLSGCVAPADRYRYDTRVSIGVGYYEPYGVFYGGWAPGYYVGPIYGNYYRPYPGMRPNPPAYRPAPASRRVPSIPARRR